MKEKYKMFIKLFFTTFYVSAFTFGGGFVIVALLRKKFVENLQWIDEKEMIDLTAIAQSSPGAVAINTCVAIGYKIARVPGVIITVVAATLPPFIVISIITVFYQWFRDNAYVSATLNGMNAGVAAVISDVCISMSEGYFKNKQIISISIMIIAFSLVFFFNVSSIFIVLIFGTLGALTSVIKSKKESKL